MLNPPKTLEAAQAYRYNEWAAWTGNKYIPTQCAWEIYNSFTYYQCSRNPGHGPEGLYCKQHAKKVGG